MSLDLFGVYGGIDITNEALSSNTNILQGAGTPSTTEADAAPVGSIWMDSTSHVDHLNFWWKHTTGSGVDKWTRAADTAYITAAVQGISWREPVVVLDATSYANVGAIPTTGVIDGVTLADGDRVLFTNIGTAGGDNVYVWNAGTTSWTEDTNAESDGDALYVQQGTYAEQQWAFDGTQWFQFGGTTTTEVLNIRNFIGKDLAGANFPDYVSNDILIDGKDLRLGISQLDDAIGNLQFTNNYILSDFVPGTIQDPDNGPSTTSITDITFNLDKIDTAFGSGNITNTGGNWAISVDGNWFSGGANTLTDFVNELNAAIGDRSYSLNNLVVDGESLAASIEKLDVALGDLDNSSAYTAGGYLSTAAIAGNSVQQNLDSFNQEIGFLASEAYSNTGSAPATTVTPLEPAGNQLLTGDATEVEWLVQVKDSGGKRQAFHVHAVTDGSTVDFTTYAVIKNGGNIGGSIGFSVVIAGGKIQPQLNPSAGAGNLTFTIKRLGYSFLA